MAPNRQRQKKNTQNMLVSKSSERNNLLSKIVKNKKRSLHMKVSNTKVFLKKFQLGYIITK